MTLSPNGWMGGRPRCLEQSLDSFGAATWGGRSASAPLCNPGRPPYALCRRGPGPPQCGQPLGAKLTLGSRGELKWAKGSAVSFGPEFDKAQPRVHGTARMALVCSSSPSWFSLSSWKSSQNPREKELAIVRSSARLRASLMLRSGVAFRMPPPAATTERPTTRPLPLVQLGLHQCKWPTEINLQVVGGYLFCAEATGGHVYCARHRKLKSGQPSRPR